MNILVQPLNTEELLLVEEWLKEQQISFKRSFIVLIFLIL